MVTKNKDAKNRLSVIIMLSAVVALTLTGIPDAMANPAIGTNESPNPAPFNGQVTFGIKDAGDGPYDNIMLAVYEPGHTNAQVLPSDDAQGAACTLANPQAGLRSWVLMYGTINGAASEALFDILDNVNSEVKIQFGLQNPAIVLLTGAVHDPTQAAGAGVFFWQERNSAGAAVTDDNDVLDVLTVTNPSPGIYRWAVCGAESNDAGSFVDTSAIDAFETQEFVGGSIIPINTVSILVAGMLASPMLLLPTIGAVILAGIGVYKFNKKQ